MSVTPLLEDSLAGKYTKEISDGWFLDRGSSEMVLKIMKEFETELYKEFRDAVNRAFIGGL